MLLLRSAPVAGQDSVLDLSLDGASVESHSISRGSPTSKSKAKKHLVFIRILCVSLRLVVSVGRLESKRKLRAVPMNLLLFSRKVSANPVQHVSF